MKTRLLIIIGIITAVIVSLLAADQYYLSWQDKELKKSDWVQDCIPVGPTGAVPLIGLVNHTHAFDLQTCSWSPTEHGKPGFLESLYISFVEPVFLDIADSLEIKYSYAVLSPLKQQIRERSDPETYVCWNLKQVLVERQNGKYACVYPYTAVKLNWEFLNDYNLSQMDTRNGNFAVFTHLSKGALTDVVLADSYPGIVIKMSTGEAGKLSINIPVEMMKDDENCLPQPVYPDYDVFFTLVNGVEVHYDERITTDSSRFIELQYGSDAIEIEIIDVCLI